MEDKRDKRPVYMSTFQKRLDRIDSEITKKIDHVMSLNSHIEIKIGKVHRYLGLSMIMTVINLTILIALTAVIAIS
jgi:hypothetical protein